jgi:N-acetyl-anhydromuramyl-L-alanine amidase AmpD
MTNIDVIGLAFKALRRRDDLKRVVTLIMPVWNALRPALPELNALINSLIKDFSPMLGEEAEVRYDIPWLQRSLNRLGFHVAVDGDYGPSTKDAVRAFQRKHNLDVDGWAGVATMAAIKHALDNVN